MKIQISRATRTAREDIHPAGKGCWVEWDREFRAWREYRTDPSTMRYKVRDARAVRALSLMTGFDENYIMSQCMFEFYPEQGSLDDIIQRCLRIL